MYSAPPIDPELQEVAATVAQQFNLITRDMVSAMRESMAAQQQAAPEPSGVVKNWESISHSGLETRVLVYRAQGEQCDQGAGIFWLHGGGYILGTAEDAMPAHLAGKFGCTVVSVEYRLAPEHPFPAAIDDSLAAYDWMRSQATALHIDPNRIALAGQSAGAGLAAGLALKIRDTARPAPAFQFLIYPMLDNLHATPSGSYEDHYVWCRQTSFNAWEMYLGGTPGDAASPYAAPARASDLSDLPESYIIVGSAELFRDECIQFAQKLMDSGVKTELSVFPGVFHGAEHFAPDSRIGKRMCATIDDAFSRCINS